jgi:hypothetical protein
MQSAVVAHGVCPPQTLGVPSAPQTDGDGHRPQLSVPPQPSAMVPHCAFCSLQVVGVQPQTLGVPPPPQVCGAAQEPQSSG